MFFNNFKTDNGYDHSANFQLILDTPQDAASPTDAPVNANVVEERVGVEMMMQHMYGLMYLGGKKLILHIVFLDLILVGKYKYTFLLSQH